jgi:hypothetical protein
MSSLLLSPNSDSTNLAIPKLRDDGSNWADYEPRIQKAMGAKGLWRHVEGKALEPKHYAMDASGDYVLADGKTPASEEQVESREAKIEDFEKKHYLAQHIILSTTSTRLSSKIKNMKTAHEMWEAVKADVTTRSTLYLIDAENQLEGMRLSDSSDPKTHLVELKAHFELMMQRHDNLIKMGSMFSDARLCTIIMTSLPPSYRPALQTITAAQKASAITSTSSSSMVKLKPADLIEFFTEEAQHRVIEEDRTKSGESALYVQSSKRKATRPWKWKGTVKEGEDLPQLWKAWSYCRRLLG